MWPSLQIRSRATTVDILQSFAWNAVFVHLHLSSAAEQGAKALNSGVHGPKPQVIMLYSYLYFVRVQRPDISKGVAREFPQNRLWL